MTIRVAIHGAAGRMGQRLVALGAADEAVELVAALDNAGAPNAGCDAGELAGAGTIGVPISADWPEACDAVIDFSVPDATDSLVEECVRRRFPLVYATTGIEAEQLQRIEAAAASIPIVKAASMSTAVNLTMKLAEIAGRTLKDLPSGVDVEILERHHRFKEDSPSGTALAFGKILADAMDKPKAAHGREGRVGARPADEIGYHAIRTGDNPGEHTIVFGMLGETIELRVAATNRDCYAQGAYTAAKWIKGKPPGLYDMQDVLGLK
ncbi:4-hydroxy-tetrahydrodipicolinate reductase [Pseudobythopirellula maris]|uniref:4-hydroxy-tetrahydrodipicolinate reductase n=1 Tax=Pseudobythopirellula maris TaxID=2527991 RepID=A0A5C5ZJP8_9BACT|nr:4-hydroxy-tetrahydrodipicolinate reductase [Pseudobythopirellula maris]TWT87599.1 4-hydroxy-tetrahydrodipicolinate reductase [Pseudobythopirellula maris]